MHNKTPPNHNPARDFALVAMNSQPDGQAHSPTPAPKILKVHNAGRLHFGQWVFHVSQGGLSIIIIDSSRPTKGQIMDKGFKAVSFSNVG